MTTARVGDASAEAGATPALGSHSGRQLGTLAGLLTLCVILWAATPHFLTVSNLLNVLEQTALNAVVAVGMTFVIISGGIDLSVGSVLALAGICLALALEAGVPAPAAIGLALVVGTGCGLINGVLITRGRLPPFIATLGMMSVARGVALMLAEGRPISGFSERFRAIATERLLAIPGPVLITIVIYAVAHFVLTRTVFGRTTYAIGGNEEAARLSGVQVLFHKTAVYGVAGLTSAAAAVVLTARLNSAQPTAGTMYELDAIAATVIGGSSLLGGEGTVTGTLIGALIMGVLRNGLNLLNVSSFLQQVVIGVVIIGAVLVDMSLKRQR
jgi:ribose/xylose/arabinose/galactoside ABC-type transport system permease subunit